MFTPSFCTVQWRTLLARILRRRSSIVWFASEDRSFPDLCSAWENPDARLFVTNLPGRATEGDLDDHIVLCIFTAFTPMYLRNVCTRVFPLLERHRCTFAMLEVSRGCIFATYAAAAYRRSYIGTCSPSTYWCSFDMNSIHSYTSKTNFRCYPDLCGLLQRIISVGDISARKQRLWRAYSSVTKIVTDGGVCNSANRQASQVALLGEGCQNVEKGLVSR